MLTGAAQKEKAAEEEATQHKRSSDLVVAGTQQDGPVLGRAVSDRKRCREALLQQQEGVQARPNPLGCVATSALLHLAYTVSPVTTTVPVAPSAAATYYLERVDDITTIFYLLLMNNSARFEQ